MRRLARPPTDDVGLDVVRLGKHVNLDAGEQQLTSIVLNIGLRNILYTHVYTHLLSWT